MTSQVLKAMGIGCLVVCAICVFIGVERYQDNAGNVEAMRQMMPSFSPLGGGEIQAATPAATKYAIFFALLSGSGGVFCLVRAKGCPGAAGRE